MVDARFAVLLHDTRIGDLEVRGQASEFAFNDAYLADAHRAVLGLRFEEDLARSRTGFRRLPCWFSNLLPEGRFRRFLLGSDESAEADGRLAVETRLLTALGGDLPGAVQCIRDVEALAERGPGIRLSGALPRPVTDESVEDPGFRFSMAGVGLKASMSEVNERFVLPMSGSTGKWIVKFPDPLFPALPANEFAMMTLARAVGIDTPSVRLLDRDQIDGVPDFFWGGERTAYAVERFDRAGAERVHIEDFAQIRDYYPDSKYRGTFETVGALVYRTKDDEQLAEFVRRLTLFLIIGNSDAHLKNWSLRYGDPRRPRLSPAYDVNSVVIYPPGIVTQDTGLRFAQRKDFASVTMRSFSRLREKLRSDLDVPAVVEESRARIEQHLPAALENLRRGGLDVDRLRAHAEQMIQQLG